MNYRTPSKDRVEKISDIKLPDRFKVIKDEYQDMIQDYSIIYEIQLDDKATGELIRSIQLSQYYNQDKGIEKLTSRIIERKDTGWLRYHSGHRFIKNGRTEYYIKLDTTRNILIYNESHD